MKKVISTTSYSYFYLIIIALFPALLQAKETNKPVRLWYDQPADEWMLSTPIGNGRLGGDGLWGCIGRNACAE